MKPAIIINAYFTGYIREFFEKNCTPLPQSTLAALANKRIRIDLVPISDEWKD